MINLIPQGAGPGNATFSDYMVHVKLVDANGEIKEFRAGDPEMAAIRACLGMCGIIVEVTLRVSQSNRTINSNTSTGNGNLFKILTCFQYFSHVLWSTP